MHKILVVVDMQNDFITGSLGTKEAQAIVPNVVAKIKQEAEAGTFIACTQDTHHNDYINTNEGRHLPVYHCLRGEPGWQIESFVWEAICKVWDKYDPADVFPIEKATFGDDVVTERLAQYILRYADNITDYMYDTGDNIEIEFIGLCTGICVLSNAILAKARFPEATISVDASCCACVTPQSHDTALAAMQLCQIEIKNQGKEPWRK